MQPDYHQSVQEFHKFVESKRRRGVAGPSVEENDENCLFVPDSDLREFFARRDRLRAILRAVLGIGEVPLPVDLDVIQDRYVKVFAILLCIGEASAIGWFVQYDSLRDSRLPFDERPSEFPIETSSNFFSRFWERQWMFCAVQMWYKSHSVWHPRRILPFLTKEEIGEGGSAVTYRIELHRGHNNLNPPSTDEQDSNTFVLKTYHGPEDEKNYRIELNAFNCLRIHTAPEPSLIGFYGGFMHGTTWNILLEYANAGTLENYFRTTIPPSTAPDILSFWRGLLRILRALCRIHEVTIEDSENQRTLTGWHQDVKPDNILVSTRKGRSIYECEFKLADLGNCHFSVKSGQNAQGRDSRGTRTYGAPECYRHDDFVVAAHLQVGSSVDIWSFGCILSEAAVWVAHGWNGLERYRERRSQTTALIPDFQDSDCFHNGYGVLEMVKNTHNDLRNDLRVSDSITRAVLDMTSVMFYPPRARPTALQLYTQAREALQAAEERLNPPAAPPWPAELPAPSYPSTVGPPAVGVPEDPAVAPVVQAFSQMVYTHHHFPFPRGRDRPGHGQALPPPGPSEHGWSQHYGGGEPDNSMATGRPDRQNRAPSFRAPRERDSTEHELPLLQRPSEHSTGEHYGEWDGSPVSATPISGGWEPDHNTATGWPNRQSTATSSRASRNRESTEHEPALRQRPSQRGTSQHGSPEHFVGGWETPAGGPFPGSGRESEYSGSVRRTRQNTATSLRVPRGRDSREPEQTWSQRTSDGDWAPSLASATTRSGWDPEGPFPTRQDSASSLRAHPAEPKVLGAFQSTNATPAESSISNRSSVVTRTSSSNHIPNLSVESVLHWRAQRKDSMVMDRYVDEYHQSQLTELNNRLHVFLIDDFTSLRDHRKELVEVFRAIAYMVKGSSPTGLELFFTSGNVRHKDKNSSGLVKLIERRPVQPGWTNMNRALSLLLGDYQRQLRTDHRQVRKLSLYVFTDGEWEPYSKAALPIKALLDTLVELKEVPKEQVVIQFIQFGAHPAGTMQLQNLDAELGVQNDIMDNEPSNGNVWKMLLGAIHKGRRVWTSPFAT